jgi:hypothetical protein
MQPRTLARLAAVVSLSAIPFGFACSSSSGDGTTSPQDVAPDASGADAPSSTGDGAAPSQDAAPATSTVTFSYTPAWSGVVDVEVVGGFGQASDWTQPLASLTKGAGGTFTGTATLPAGQYLYVFKVTGDDASAQKDKLVRYAIDPSVPAWAACPSTSPTYNKNEPNPCAEVSVPQGAPAATYHVTGSVTLAGAPAGSYLVEVEREEAQSHHFFANRMTTAADGTFDLAVAAGKWRLQVLHPTYYQQNDAQRDPMQNDALRRAISAAFDVAADVAVGVVEVKYDGYGAMQPRGDAGALPTSFTYTVLSDATGARLAVYGPGNSIGDPWFASPVSTAATLDFDGGYNTKQAPADAGGVSSGKTYYWGTEQALAHPEAGVAWTGQSMVYPVSWP